jgi:cytochrome d ubiquinol oxidase subunit I
MKTADAVTPMPGLAASFVLFTILYFFLAVVVAYLLWEQVIESPKKEEATAFAAASGR